MLSLRHLSPLTLAGCVAVVTVALVGFLGLVALRFQRRGSSRFWAAPAALALCLLPVATACVFAGLLIRHVLAGMALTGSGGAAAISAGGAEALLPLQIGLGALLALAACAFLATAVGSARTQAHASGGALSAWALLLVGLGAAVSLAVIVSLVLWMAAGFNRGWLDPGLIPSRLGLVITGSAALVAVTFVLALAGALIAPRGPSDLAIKLGSLAALALCGVLGVAGLWATWARSRSLMATAITGLPEGALPEPPPEPILEEQAATPMPPPPPPPEHDIPPRAASRSRPREATPRSIQGAEGRVYRVGGTIKEPTRLKNVSPIYPEIAKQARVQGVVILEATISARGDVTSVTVLRGVPLLDQAAVDAVEQWVYAPTLLNGVPVPVIMTVTVNFRLR